MHKRMNGAGQKTMVALLALGCVWAAGPAHATQQGQERRAARDTRQDAKQDARQDKVDCRQADQKSNAACRHDKRDTKQDGRQDARDIKY